MKLIRQELLPEHRTACQEFGCKEKADVLIINSAFSWRMCRGCADNFERAYNDDCPCEQCDGKQREEIGERLDD